MCVSPLGVCQGVFTPLHSELVDQPVGQRELQRPKAEHLLLTGDEDDEDLSKRLQLPGTVAAAAAGRRPAASTAAEPSSSRCRRTV